MLEYGNDGKMGNIASGRGSRLRAQDEQTLVPPEQTFFQPVRRLVRRRYREGGSLGEGRYSNIPPFRYSFTSYLIVYSLSAGGELTSKLDHTSACFKGEMLLTFGP